MQRMGSLVMMIVILLSVSWRMSSGAVSAQDEPVAAYELNWSPDGRWIGVGSSAGAWLFDPDDLLAPPRRYFTGSAIYSVAFDPVRAHFAVAPNEEDQALVVEIESGAVLYHIQAPPVDSSFSVFYDIAYDPSGALLAVTNGAAIYVVDAETRTPLYTLTDLISPDYAYSNWITSIAFSPMGDRSLYASDWNGRLIRFNLGENAKRVDALVINDNGVEEIYARPGSADILLRPFGRLAYYSAEAETWRELTVADLDWLNGLAISPDGALAAFGVESQWGLYDIDSESVVALYDTIFADAELIPRVYSLAFNPDGTRLATLQTDGVLTIWDTQTGTAVMSHGAFTNDLSQRWG